jgi:hypothetical protein
MGDAEHPSPAADGSTPAPARAVRHAEKPREATCAFADSVAAACIDAFRALDLPDGSAKAALQSHQTVLAGFVLSCGQGQPLRVVSLGVGTRVVPDSLLAQDADGRRVFDCHAEVLARRGLVVFLLEELRAFLQQAQPGSLFEAAERRPRLKPSLRFHLYCSSAPCGNACVRRFAKAAHDVFDARWGALEWPSLPHPKFTRQCEEQCAVLCKADHRPPASPQLPEAKKSRREPVCPPGCALPGSAAATSRATCSDKIARWCAAGAQGALLQSLADCHMYVGPAARDGR